MSIYSSSISISSEATALTHCERIRYRELEIIDKPCLPRRGMDTRLLEGIDDRGRVWVINAIREKSEFTPAQTNCASLSLSQEYSKQQRRRFYFSVAPLTEPASLAPSSPAAGTVVRAMSHEN